MSSYLEVDLRPSVPVVATRWRQLFGRLEIGSGDPKTSATGAATRAYVKVLCM